MKSKIKCFLGLHKWASVSLKEDWVFRDVFGSGMYHSYPAVKESFCCSFCHKKKHRHIRFYSESDAKKYIKSRIIEKETNNEL